MSVSWPNEFGNLKVLHFAFASDVHIVNCSLKKIADLEDLSIHKPFCKRRLANRL